MKRVLKTIWRGLAALIPCPADWRAMGAGGIVAALLSAVLMTLVFPKWDLNWLVWIGLVPIFLATRNRPARAAKWLWYLFAVVWFYASYFWFNVTDYVNVLIWPAIVLMSLILGLWILLFGWGAMRLRRLGLIAFLLIPMWWVAIEYLRTIGSLSLPWLFLAHSQYGHPSLIQSASVFGTHALSFLILAGNLLLAEGIAQSFPRLSRFLRRRKNTRQPVTSSEDSRGVAHFVRSAPGYLISRLRRFGRLATHGSRITTSRLQRSRGDVEPVASSDSSRCSEDAVNVVTGKRWTPVAVAAAIWIVLIIVNIVAGRAAVERWSQPGLGEPIRLAIVQPNWDQIDKFDAEWNDAIAMRLIRGMIEQTREIEPGSVDLVLLPESVIFELYFPLRGSEWFGVFAAEASRLQATVVFGANNVVPPEGPAEGEGFSASEAALHNSVWSVSPTGERAVFDKVRLVAFSESAPVLDWIPGLTDILLGVITFDSGAEWRNLPVESPALTTQLGAHICFESTFPSAVRQFPLRGAEILATITNDGWFLDSAGPYQHWTAQPFRAVENRRWMAQVANTGISSLINPAGVPTAQSSLNERTTLLAEAERLDTQTIYTRHGDWAAQLSLALCAALILWTLVGDRRRARRNENTV